MGDIIGSTEYDATPLRKEFLALIAACNHELESSILSPYTVTLGDEFQGVAGSLFAMIESIFYLDEAALRRGLLFKIRYVALQGQIDTPLNRRVAYSMLGAGLTRARELLTNKGRGTSRYRLELEDSDLTDDMNRLFLVVEGVTERWNLDDAQLILDMIENRSDAEVGAMHDKNRSQIWKRRKTLLIEEYRALKETIMSLAQRKGGGRK